jgi:hypothetical protein
MLQEEYLLGKKIGQNFEAQGTMGQINAVEYDCAPPSIFASKAQHQVHHLCASQWFVRQLRIPPGERGNVRYCLKKLNVCDINKSV